MFFQWPHNWVDLGILKDITFLEFVPIVLSMAIWGSRLQNKKVKFYIDNRALVDIINTQTSKSKRVMALMRPFILYTLQNNIIFRARYIEGKNNEIADAISRQQWDRFRRLAPQAQANPGPFSDMDLQYKADRLLEGSMALNTLNSYRTGLASYEKFLSFQ